MRRRTGDVVIKQGAIHARVTWTENGKRRAKWRRATSYEHARELCAVLLLEIPIAERPIGGFEPNPESRMRQGLSVYFVQMLDGHTNPIKIGIAADVQRRLDNLQTGSPFPLVLLNAWEGVAHASGLELIIHGYFKPLRMLGEWFQPSTELIEFARNPNIETVKKWVRDASGTV